MKLISITWVGNLNSLSSILHFSKKVLSRTLFNNFYFMMKIIYILCPSLEAYNP